MMEEASFHNSHKGDVALDHDHEVGDISRRVYSAITPATSSRGAHWNVLHNPTVVLSVGVDWRMPRDRSWNLLQVRMM